MSSFDVQRRAMRLSVAAGLAMLAGKSAAWWLTGSAAIFSDAVESVVHVAAVVFAAMSLRVSYRPATPDHPYGYERIAFFSAGFEGAAIVLAAVVIIVEALRRLAEGAAPGNLGAGTGLVLLASAINLALGLYLVRTGRATNSLIVEANGKHVLTDSWTSFGVVVGLLLVMLTGWAPLDPLVAMGVATHILWSGGTLVWRSLRGLLDYVDPTSVAAVERELTRVAAEHGLQHHEMRCRDTGSRLLIEVHLLFPWSMPVGEAHGIATQIEQRLEEFMGGNASVITHLEAAEDHDRVHTKSADSTLESR